MSGQLLAGTGATGAVTMAGAGGNTVGGCAGSAPILAIPTLGSVGMAMLAILLAAAGLSS